MEPEGSLTDSTAADAHAEKMRKGKQGNLLVLSGPSGVGKGTVVSGLLGSVPGLVRSVSVTTRPMRSSEVEGVDYFFLTHDQFQNARDNGELLEWAEFAGEYYGTPKKWVEQTLATGQDVLLVIEVQGAKQVHNAVPGALLIFLLPPSFDELESRLRQRATESAEKIARRLSKAREEIAEKHLFDYEVVNDIVENAVNNLAHIIYSERLRIRNFAK